MPIHTAQIKQQLGPWWAPMMVEHIAGILRPDMSVFEYGSGASTLWLAERAQTVISVEHDKEWFESVRELCPQNAEITLSERPYHRAIDRYGEFDLIVVDGRDRVKCILHSLPHVRAGGYLLLDDCEREYYNSAVQAMRVLNWGRCIAEQDIHGQVKKALLVRTTP